VIVYLWSFVSYLSFRPSVPFPVLFFPIVISFSIWLLHTRLFGRRMYIKTSKLPLGGTAESIYLSLNNTIACYSMAKTKRTASTGGQAPGPSRRTRQRTAPETDDVSPTAVGLSNLNPGVHQVQTVPVTFFDRTVIPDMSTEQMEDFLPDGLRAAIKNTAVSPTHSYF
jgi:hypothetical protein